MDDFFHHFHALPSVLSAICIFLIGILLAVLVNLAVYALAYHHRPISPWQARHPQAPSRHWFDRLPLIGWWSLRREDVLHGKRYWLRPFLVEIAFPACLVYLYVWQLNGGLYARGISDIASVHKQFLLHAVLWCWILIATLVDLDELMIPDGITIPGTLMGLFLVAWMPQSVLPVDDTWLHLVSPHAWPIALEGRYGLVLGLVAFLFWCLALVMPPRLRWRKGWWRVVRLWMASCVRDRSGLLMILIAVLGSAAIAWVWSRGGLAWQSLLSSLAGLLFGMLLTWSVRLVAAHALRKEALGFGDVTLMGMIGAYLGWQPTMIVFFVAPFLAIFVAVANLILSGTREIPYGPYLSMAAVVVTLAWPYCWERWGPIFYLGWWVPSVLLVCVILMGVMLSIWRKWRENA